MITESPNPRAEGLDRMSTLEAARLMNAEDRRVPAAIEEVLPAIAESGLQATAIVSAPRPRAHRTAPTV